MFDRAVSTRDATPLQADEHLDTLRSLMSALQDFAVAGPSDAAVQQDVFVAAPLWLAGRYATANSITRRRFDAVLREADTVARMGYGVLAGRRGRSDAGTVTAARFLGNSLSTTLRRLENLLAPPTM